MSRNINILLLLLVLLGGPPDVRAEDTLVLIASSSSPIESVTAIELRKLYLGFIVTTVDGLQIRPLNNAGDAQIHRIFLQDVMGMSARSYDRRLLTLTLQSGRPRPSVHENVDEIINLVSNDDLAISFVWKKDIDSRSDIKILRVLWRR